jgi:hypothetical protein
VSEPPKTGEAAPQLPEPFAPRGPRLTRFFIQPAPPLRPHLFPDEARFALRLCLLLAATELCAWGALAGAAARGPLAHHAATLLLPLFALLRLAAPLWARLGTRLPRPLLAGLLLALALLGQGAALLGPLYPRDAAAAGLLALLLAGAPALGQLVQSHVADSITVERRQAAFAWLEVGQGLGCALGLALGTAFPRGVTAWGALGLVLAGMAVPDLRDRGTPRSSWDRSARREAARTPLGRTLGGLALATGLLAGPALAGLVPLPHGGPFLLLLLPTLGMALATRLAPRARNAVELPGLVAAAAAAALLLALGSLLLLHRLPPYDRPPRAEQLMLAVAAVGRWTALLSLGAAATALPTAVAQAGAELQRPLLSARCRSALLLGCALSAAAALW